MSMISAQCDKLRNAADELDERAKAYAPTGRNVLSPMLRSAAETIWELRCKLVGTVDQQDEIERLKTENAKLRKLLANALMVCGFHGRQYLDNYLREEEGTTLLDELRAVGIEMDDTGRNYDGR